MNLINTEIPLPVLSTQRLLLRPMSELDAETIVRWRNAPHISEMSVETSKGALTVPGHLGWFARTRSKRVDYVIEEKKIGPIGVIGYIWHSLYGSDRVGEISRYIGEEQAQGQGYGGEAKAEWLKYGFEQLGLDYVISRTRSDNRAIIEPNLKRGHTIEEWPVTVFGEPVAGWIFMRLTRSSWAKSQQNIG